MWCNEHPELLLGSAITLLREHRIQRYDRLNLISDWYPILPGIAYIKKERLALERNPCLSVYFWQQVRSMMWWEVQLTTAECCALAGRKELQLYKVLLLLKDNFLWKINCQSSEKCYRWDISLGEDDWRKLNTNQASSEAVCYNLYPLGPRRTGFLTISTSANKI